MCRCDVKCSICSGKHHKCIHGIRMFESVPRPTNRQSVNNAMSVTTRVQFQLLPVLVRGANGRSEYTVALLDSASRVSLIHPKLKTKLDLRGCRKKLMLTTLAGTGISYDSEAVGCFVRDKLNPDGKELDLKSVFVCDNRIPHPERRQTDFETFHHLRGIPLPDIKENEVMLLIGADHPFAHFQLERRVGGDNEPIAIRTPLGWTLLGANKRAGEVDLIQANCHLLHDDYNILQEQVKQFWSTDAIGMVYNMKRAESAEDRVAADMIRAKTSIVDGHYQVGFLWRHDASIMPENSLIARTRFKNLKYRLLKNDCLRDMYCTSMRKNIERGWVRKLTDKERDTLGPRTWYLPHHGVQNPNKPGKIRIVFDAAATYCGISLNNQIYSGPDLINNLIGVLLRFRERPVALNADIEAMYHMVRLPQSDTDSVRFFWQEDLRSTSPPDVYQFLVRIFGAVDSPYVANYCLEQTALDNTSQFSTEAVETVLRDFYVDDLLSSKWNDDSAFSVAQEVSNMLASRGFRLTKWLSNSKTLLSKFNTEDRLNPDVDLDFDCLPVSKALGLHWNTNDDDFFFIYNSLAKPVTKREALSATASVFDPLGILTPIILTAKLLIRECWRDDLKWDENFDDRRKNTWGDWTESLKQLTNFRVPRQYLGVSKTDATYELHLFCDASEQAYGTVAYLRAKKGQCVNCSFLMAKSRVSPMKHMSVPRLELQSALLSARLLKFLRKSLTLPITCEMLWSDSTCVLRYLRNTKTRFKTFVANRLREILDYTEPAQWRYVNTQNNPADCCTRVMPMNKFIESDNVWISGPKFLLLPESS
uniref:uncharacterized protein LOC120338039 n=1 Tax=Styela clava TaxID=7725 RepID=UPI00193A586D|nr:uncharacterized protein LOC120338039 [Styela clava]